MSTARAAVDAKKAVTLVLGLRGRRRRPANAS